MIKENYKKKNKNPNESEHQFKNLVCSSKLFSEGVLQTEFNKCILINLLQAVIDDEQKTVSKILDGNPGLLLLDPKSMGILKIQSKLTLQIFLCEKPFIMALIRKQFEIVEADAALFSQVRKWTRRSLNTMGRS